MKPLTALPLALSVALAVAPLHAQQGKQTKIAKSAKKRSYYPPQLPGAESHVYKEVGDVKLKLWVYRPKGASAQDRRGAIVFFFGGGWRSGSPQQFEHQCKALAEQGMVAMTADYRVSTRHETKAIACVADAKSAIRWVRQNAAMLGVDPDRVAAGGGSAGGHIAACTGVVKAYDEESEDANISSSPNALVLFNPALALAPVDGRNPLTPEKTEEMPSRVGADPKLISPIHHVRPKAPPTIIFHGKADDTVPYWTAEAFTKAMIAEGNRCELKGYEDEAHGFFNYGRNGNVAFESTTKAMIGFLKEQKIISPNE